MHKKTIVQFLFLLLLSLFIFGCSGETGQPRVVQGFLDLSQWDADQDGPVTLDGAWEFYWNRLLSPDDFKVADPPEKTGFFTIPGYWNGHLVNGRPLPGQGYATFRLRVRLKPGQETLALRIEDQATAYRLWINTHPVMANGRVGMGSETMQPYYKVSIASFRPDTEYLDCVLQVSNFYLANGGPYRKIMMGGPEAVQKRQITLFSVDLLLFGILLIIGLYHIVFYWLRRKDPAPLYFGGFCLSWALGIPFGAAGGKFITLLFPMVPWYLLGRMEMLSWFPTPPLMLLFFASLYPAEMSGRIARLAKWIGFLFFIYALAAPSQIIAYAEIPYQIVSLALAAYIGGMLFRAWQRKRDGAALMFAGYLIFFATVVNDILFANLIIYSIYLISAGFTVMALIQSFTLFRLFARSFSAVEALTAELEQKNMALSRLDTLKDEFLANTSHELRTPLNGIIGIAESLLSGITGKLTAGAERNLAMVVASGKRLSGLINDILDFSRLRYRDIQLRQRAVDMRALTDTVLTVMQPLVANKPVELHNDIPDTVPLVWGDEDRLQQVLYNLLGNAVKFTDQGQIRVSAAHRDPWVEIVVSDTGLGIAADKQERIFQPFEQGDASAARLHGGTGLGLSITRQLVELHGGKIRVESAPGSGSTFRFTLPQALADSGGIAESKPLEEVGPIEQPAVMNMTDVVEPLANLPGFESDITILAIDDDPINLQVVANHLTFKNVTLISATGGRQAVDIIEKGSRPDLVLLDIMMPRMTGYEFCQWLRQRYSLSEMPVIMLTAKSGTDDLAQGFSQGANDYLVKPFLKDELLARVVSQLKLKQFYLTLRENLSLRKELEQRKQTEQELRLIQQRLSGLLNTVQEPLLGINESREIGFCNRACEALLGCGASDLLGRSVRELIVPSSAAAGLKPGPDPFQECLETGTAQDLGLLTVLRTGKPALTVRAVLILLDLDEERLCVLILKEARGKIPAESSPGFASLSLNIIEELNQKLGQAQALEESLAHDPDQENRRSLAQEIMTRALACWTEQTGATKVELAFQSKIWKVYTNQDGWQRAQTFDRYLQFNTLPRRPHWRRVIETAHFVLAHCRTHSPARERLETTLSRLQART